MIIINLKGGTGNQLFQYALGRHLAIKNNDVLKLDISGLDQAHKNGDIYRPFTLNAFNIKKEIATPEEVRLLKYPYGILSKIWRLFSSKILRQNNILFNPSILNSHGDLYLDGYWQSPNYFNQIRKQLLEEITLINPLSEEAAFFAEKISKSAAVSLHVRRGDYANNPRVFKEFGICSIEYYEKAIQQIKESVDSPSFFIFSDDMEWVKNNLPIDDNSTFVKGENISDTEELTLMSMCNHNIIANSSFSWWGAWLNQNPDKIVTAPTPWFNQKPYDKDLIPKSWIQIQK